MILPALTVLQPYANWMIYGAPRKNNTVKKAIETRVWQLPEKYLNTDIIIHSGKSIHPAYDESHCRGMLKGYALGTVKFSECRPMTYEDEALAMCLVDGGAYSWVVSESKAFETPFEARGMQRIFKIEFDEKLTSSKILLSR